MRKRMLAVVVLTAAAACGDGGGDGDRGPSATPTLGPTPTATATPGPFALDPTFGEGGIAIPPGAGAKALARDRDGRLIIVGPSRVTGVVEFAVSGFSADGRPTGFGIFGTTLTGFDGSAEAQGVAVQADGAAVVVGSVVPVELGEGVVRIGLARYQGPGLSWGLADPSFGTDFGKREDAVGDANTSGVAVAVQPDGKIVVAGAANGGEPFTTRLALVRYDASGDRDPSFGTDGVVLSEPLEPAGARALLLEPDGRIVVASGDRVARYLADGTPDPSFGESGITPRLAVNGIRAVEINDVVRREDGTLLLGGTVETETPPPDPAIGVLALTSAGTLDASFGTGGLTVSLLDAPSAFGNALAIAPDGRLVIAGSVTTGAGGVEEMVLVRYLPDGTPDASFGPDGVLTPVVSSGVPRANDLLVQPDGKLVIAGRRCASGNCLSVETLLARFAPA